MNTKMDLQTLLNNEVAAQRAEKLKNSPQLLLGELILKLESVKNKDLPLFIDLMDKRPKGVDSWRGVYAELPIQTEVFGSYQTKEIEKLKIRKGQKCRLCKKEIKKS